MAGSSHVLRGSTRPQREQRRTQTLGMTMTLPDQLRLKTAARFKLAHCKALGAGAVGLSHSAAPARCSPDRQTLWGEPVGTAPLPSRVWKIRCKVGRDGGWVEGWANDKGADMQLQTLEDVLVEQIADLQSAEGMLIDALPKMASAASNTKLREAFEHHLDQTRTHVRRLADVAAEIGQTVPTETCKAMEGLIAEGSEVIRTTGDPNAKDAALIAAAQRVEHYEIAAYGTARTLANELGMKDAARLLDETLGEEGEADKLLTKLATGGMLASGINKRAER